MSFTPCRSLFVAGTAFFFLPIALAAEAPKAGVPAAEKTVAVADARVRFLEQRVASDPDDFIAWNQLGDRRLALLRETGRMEHLAKARASADASVKALGEAKLNPGGLNLQVRVALAEHRFAAAREKAEQLLEISPKRDLPLQLRFDAEIELGHLETAGKTLAEIQKLAPFAVETHARAQRLAWQRGKIADALREADAALAAAMERSDSTAPIGWAHVQRGELAFRLGDFPTAEKHYQAALGPAPGNWSAREHLAELLAAEGKFPEALASLAAIIEESGRPELMQAAGDVAKAASQPEEAAKWHARALEGMKASADRGEALYTHHLAGLYADSLSKPEEAVAWAQKDVAERSTSHSLDALAWALNLSGKYAEAADAAQKALATGTRDPHILYRAGMIFTSAGKLPAAREALRAAAEINPRQQAFHFHR